MFEDYKYTISDIAKMTKLTDRTIRNYLAKGNLKGMKMGGQWRFSKNDIYSLFNNDKFEDDMKQKTLQNIVDFFDSTDYEKNHNTACCIFSLLFKDVEQKKNFFAKLKEIKSKEKIKEKISFIDELNVKLVIIAKTETILEIASIIKEVQV
jgi:excisionase family DNA binding protein